MGFTLNFGKEYNKSKNGNKMKTKVNRNTLIKMIKNREDVTNVNTSEITDMNQLFYGITDFEQDISNWDVSSVEDMYMMFAGCKIFDQDLSYWNVSNVTDMSMMFAGCEAFNQNISGWNISPITNMNMMFAGCCLLPSFLPKKNNL